MRVGARTESVALSPGKAVAARSAWPPACHRRPRFRRSCRAWCAAAPLEPSLHYGVPRRRRAVGAGIGQPGHPAGQLRRGPQLLRWPRGHAIRSAQERRAVLLGGGRGRAGHARCGCWPCWTAARRSSTRRSIRRAASRTGAATSPGRTRTAAAASQILATRAGRRSEPDAVQAFALVERHGGCRLPRPIDIRRAR